jgi:hypothetical protein
MEKVTTQEDIKYIMERSCLNKRSYTQKQADSAIEFAAIQNRLFYYYKCQFCSSFHLTSKEPITFKHLEVV